MSHESIACIGRIAASFLLKIIINHNELCHTIRFLNQTNIQSITQEDQKNMIAQVHVYVNILT